MSVASNLVDQYIAKEKAKESTVLLDVGSGFITVTREMAQKCVEHGIGKIVERRKSCLGLMRDNAKHYSDLLQVRD